MHNNILNITLKNKQKGKLICTCIVCQKWFQWAPFKVCVYSLTLRVTEGSVFNIKSSMGDKFIGMEIDSNRMAIFSVSAIFWNIFTVSGKAKVAKKDVPGAWAWQVDLSSLHGLLQVCLGAMLTGNLTQEELCTPMPHCALSYLVYSAPVFCGSF